MNQRDDERSQTADDGEQRPMPEGAGKMSDLDFHPIRIKGEPLSETVLRERRERDY